MVIGISGKYCAGKNYVSGFFASMGFTEIDVDGIGHTVLNEKKDTLIREFGDSIAQAQGNIDRKKLGEIVFSDRHRRHALESIVHPAMIQKVTSAVRSQRRNYIINAALLFKMGLERLCQAVVCVKAPLSLRVIRALRRDKISLLQIIKRLLSQTKICPKLPPGNVDIYYVYNRGKTEDLKKQIQTIVSIINEKRK